MDRIEDPLDRSSQATFITWMLPLPKTVPSSMVHVHSLENKRRIFDRMNTAMASERDLGEAILLRLQTLSPQIAELFEVKIHQIDEFARRIVNNRPDESVSEDSYVALSYCWPKQYQASANDSELSIPTSEVLFQAAMGAAALLSRKTSFQQSQGSQRNFQSLFVPRIWQGYGKMTFMSA